MSWFRKPKKKEKEPIKYFVPENEIMGLLEMIDKDDNLKTNVTQYALWRKVEKIFPELDIKVGSWRLFFRRDILSPYIIEIKEDAK